LTGSPSLSSILSTMSTRQRPARVAPAGRRRPAWVLELYQSSLGKKYVMAVTGIVLMLYVLLHMIGNLKVYFGPASINHYGEFLRDFGEPALPRTVFLWIVRLGLIVAFALHLHAAYGLTRVNWRAAPPIGRYRSRRDYVAADFASRTMRWTGIIVGLYVLFHLMDLTWGNANPDFVRGDVYHNLVGSFSRWPVAAVYIVANLALGLHLYHGAWSLFQSMGWSNRRFNHWRRPAAVAFAAVVTAGNVTFPIAVLTGVVG
jgi:succinate dehydrogenase / fumarate reductase, cytochrome b subunit